MSKTSAFFVGALLIAGVGASAETINCKSKEVPPYNVKIVQTDKGYVGTIDYDGVVMAERGVGYNIQKKTKKGMTSYSTDLTTFKLSQASGVLYRVDARLDFGGGVLTLGTWVICGTGE